MAGAEENKERASKAELRAQAALDAAVRGLEAAISSGQVDAIEAADTKIRELATPTMEKESSAKLFKEPSIKKRGRPKKQATTFFKKPSAIEAGEIARMTSKQCLHELVWHARQSRMAAENTASGSKRCPKTGRFI